MPFPRLVDCFIQIGDRALIEFTAKQGSKTHEMLQNRVDIFQNMTLLPLVSIWGSPIAGGLLVCCLNLIVL